MIKIKFISFLIFILFLTIHSSAGEPSKLIKKIVDEASIILSSSDPVESKIIKLNSIAENNVDINGIGMYTLGNYRKSLNENQKIIAEKIKENINKKYSDKVVTKISPVKNYCPAEEYHQRYLEKR